MTSSVRNLLNESWQFYQTHFGLLGGYAAWLLLPYAAVVLVALLPQGVIASVLEGFFTLIQLVLSVWIGIALTLMIDFLLDKPEAKNIMPKHFPDHAWKLILPVFLVGLLQAVVVVGGFILLIVPGIIFSIWFAFAQFSTMLDGLRGMRAMNFSRELVRGRFWPITWRLVAGPFVIGLFYLLATGLLVLVISGITGTNMDVLLQTEPPLWIDVIGSAFEIFLMPLYFVYLVKLYKELKKV